jgi:hypothetical protein
MSTASQNGQPSRPDEVPISSDPRHPVNSTRSNVYLSRTDNLIGLTPQAQAAVLVDAMRSVGRGNVLLLEASGPRNGSYTDELRVAMREAFNQVPKEQRPEIRLFISDGRPVVGGPNQPNDPTAPRNDFGQFLQTLETQKKNSGIAVADDSQNNPRVIPNWRNPEVVDYFINNRVQPAIALARDLGITNIVVDDHMGVPPKQMPTFMQNTGITNNAQAVNTITGAYEQVFGAIRAGGMTPGLSTAADPAGNLGFGIDTKRLAGNRDNPDNRNGRADTIEIQAYRQTPALVGTMLDNLYNDVSRNFEQYRNIKEFNIALTTRANNVNLTPDTLIQQQALVDKFEVRIQQLYRDNKAQVPQVNTSLWAHQHFYQDPNALRLGQQGDRVRTLQEALNAANAGTSNPRLETNGTFNEQTKNAVSAYQKDKGLAISGVADKETLLSLGIHPKQGELRPDSNPSQPNTPPNTNTNPNLPNTAPNTNTNPNLPNTTPNTNTNPNLPNTTPNTNTNPNLPNTAPNTNTNPNQPSTTPNTNTNPNLPNTAPNNNTNPNQPNTTPNTNTNPNQPNTTPNTNANQPSLTTQLSSTAPQSTAPATPNESGRQLITHPDHPGYLWLQQADRALLRTPEGQQMTNETRTLAAASMAQSAINRIGKIESGEVLPDRLISSDRPTTRQPDARLASANRDETNLLAISQNTAQQLGALGNPAPKPISEANTVARNPQNPNEQIGNPTLAQDTRQTPRIG